MTTYNTDQALQFAAAAGFKNQSAYIITAIAMTESTLNDQALYINTDGSRDRGILQINDKWHSEVSNSCAYNAQCSFKEAYRISSNGTSFTQWATYNTPKYFTNLNSISIAIVNPNPFNDQNTIIPNSIITSFNTVSTSVNNTLNTIPGFKGIVESLDLIEQFQPLELKSTSTATTQGVDFTLFGFDTSIPDPSKVADKVQKAIALPADNMQAILVFITTNSAAAFSRGILIFIGLILIIALVMNIQGEVADKSSGVLSKVLPMVL